MATARTSFAIISGTVASTVNNALCAIMITIISVAEKGCTCGGVVAIDITKRSTNIPKFVTSTCRTNIDMPFVVFKVGLAKHKVPLQFVIQVEC